MAKYWILYEDFGYSERGICGITDCEETANAWQASDYERESAPAELFRLSLPETGKYID